VISLNKGTWIISKLLLECKLVESGKEAQRQVQQGAVSINGEKIADDRAVIQIESEIVIKVGKRKFSKIIPT
ncbi:MAG TPA: S4 domain-containing protein, partial [bacterium]|nr:S4 domain-containing protein [bacterium]